MDAAQLPGLQVRLLGGIEVTRAGAVVDLGPAKCRALLAAFALTPGAAIPVWQLIESLWGQAPPRTAQRTLQSYIARLRGALGAQFIVRQGPAYRLALPAEAVDVWRFERSLDAGDIKQALAEWTGHPLVGTDAPGLVPAVDGLVERWRGAVESDLARRVEIDPASAVGSLTELTAQHPFREGLSALLITAFYRLGRQADALAAYRSVRQRLVRELGVEPGPRLRELEAMILDQDRRMDGEAEPARPGNLPRRSVRLIGRDRELQVIRSLLERRQVVTLVGAGGIGKTALGIAAGRQADLEDGAWMVDLAEISTSDDVPAAVAAVLRVKEGRDRSLSESVVAALRSRRALLFLDNCDHVVDGVGALVGALVDACPGVQVLATSRERLGLHTDIEQPVQVEPLEAGTAAPELFLERAQAFDPAFGEATSRATIQEICRRLDGLPLAIELAAARVTTLTPDELLVRLDDQLRVLVGGRRTAAGRHRTMRSTIHWSFDLLSPVEKRVFQRLSVFSTSFDLDGAEAVCGRAGDVDPDVDDVQAALHSLVLRSMVVAWPGRFGQRFRLLEPLRQFASECLRKTRGEPWRTLEARDAWCRARVARYHPMVAGPDEVAGVALLDELWPDLRAAVERAQARQDAGAQFELIRPILTEGAFRHRQEVGRWSETLLDQIAPEDAGLVPFALLGAAPRYHLRQDPRGFADLVDRFGARDHPVVRHVQANVRDDYLTQVGTAAPAIAVLRAQGADDLAEQLEVDRGAALLFQGHYRRGEEVLRELVARYRDQGPATLLNWTLSLLGFSAAFQGDNRRAQELFDAAVAVPLPDRTHSPNRTVEAGTLFRNGSRAAGMRVLRGYVVELLDADNMQGCCVAAVEFVTMMAAAGRIDEGARMLAFLDATGFLDNAGWANLVADSRSALQAPDASATGATPITDHRRALAYMRDVLGGGALDVRNGARSHR